MNSVAFFLSEVLVFIILAVPAWLILTGHKKIAAWAWLSAGLAGIVSKLIKDFFFTPRPYPFQVFDGSFPSLHTSTSFALAFFITFTKPKLGVVLIGLSLLVGLGRVLSSAHYGWDIVAGISLGWVCAKIVHLTNYHS